MSRTEQPDSEINALLLVGCFGWRWEKRKYEGRGESLWLTAIIAPENDAVGYEPTNYIAERWVPSNEMGRRFDDWQTANAKIDRQTERIITTALPNFCQDRNLVAQWLWPLLGDNNVLWSDYNDWLIHMVERRGRNLWRDTHCATPRQQAEAVLRVRGLWPAGWDAAEQEERS